MVMISSAAETAGLSCNRSLAPREYLIPNFVSDCCKRLEIEGIKYYGGKDYSNYVSWHEGYFEFVKMESIEA